MIEKQDSNWNTPVTDIMKRDYEERLIFLHRIINSFPKFLTGLEVWNMLTRQGNRVTSFRVASRAWWTVM